MRHSAESQKIISVTTPSTTHTMEDCPWAPHLSHVTYSKLAKQNPHISDIHTEQYCCIEMKHNKSAYMTLNMRQHSRHAFQKFVDHSVWNGSRMDVNTVSSEFQSGCNHSTGIWKYRRVVVQ